MARATVPAEYIHGAFKDTTGRARVKRLRERVITFGYHLITQLDEVLEEGVSVSDIMWRQALLSTSTQFFLSVEQLHDFIMEQKGTV